jgi:hypothetical protein
MKSTSRRRWRCPQPLSTRFAYQPRRPSFYSAWERAISSFLEKNRRGSMVCNRLEKRSTGADARVFGPVSALP